MAFYKTDDEEQQDPNAEGGAVQTGPASTVISGGDGGAGDSQAPNAPGAPDSGGNFVGLKTYLDANKKQSSKLGDQVTGYTGANDAAQSVNNLGSQFNEKVQAGSIANLDQAENEGKNILNQANTTGQVGADQANRFKEIAGATYKGPNNLIDTDAYMPAYGKVKSAQNKAALTNTESGQQQLLKDMTGAPVNYTAGANRFDSYLLNSDENRQKLAGARDTAGALSGQLTAQEQAAAEKAAAVKGKTDVTRESLLKAFGRFDDPATPEDESEGALGSYGQTINSRLADTTAQEKALAARLKAGQITQDDLAKFGLQDQANYGVDLSKYYNGGVPTAAGVTTAEEKARYDALMSLANDGGAGLYGGANPADFGNYKQSVDTGRFSQDVAANQNLYEVQQPKQLANSLVQSYLNRGGTSYDSAPAHQEFFNAVRGAKDAEQIKAALNKFDSQLAAMGQDINYMPEQAALRKYLNETLPAMRNKSLTGQITPNLPTTGGGGIDWGGIKPPTGGPGKGYVEEPEEVFDPNAPKKR